ncbi:MAG: beta-N-acetylhexosaminidase, partial [Ruminococcus sp.]|nr:beta-N-acetylhexosaminidase [Ruminococcus sp.]
MKKALAVLLALTMLVSVASCSDKDNSSVQKTESSSQTVSSSESEPSSQADKTDTRPKYQQYASMTPEEITAKLTLEQKADQMVQPAVYNVTPEQMKTNDYG